MIKASFSERVTSEKVFYEVPGGTEIEWQTSYELPNTLPWKLAGHGVALFNIAFLNLLAHMIGKEVRG